MSASWRKRPAADADVCVVAPDPDGELAMTCAVRSARMGIPCAVMVDSSLEVHELDVSGQTDAALGYLVASDPKAALESLARWLVKACKAKSLALAANFPFVRPAKIRDLVDSCAAENAAIGAIEFIPGADLPAMTMNQAKLAVQIAAATGVELRIESLADLAGVLGAGFVYRAVASQVAGAIPGVGWAVKGAIGYLGTQATGNALALRYGTVPEGPLSQGGLDDVLNSLQSVPGNLGDLLSTLAKLVGERGAGSADADKGSGFTWIGGGGHEA